jgi:hypothetical protein
MAEQVLTASTANTQLVDVCATVGLDPATARLLGPIGDNAVFLLPGEAVVVRLSTGQALPEARHQLEVARWLAREDFPAVRVCEGVSQPVERSGLVVTFWEEIPGLDMASTADMGALLHDLHRLREPDGLLKEFDPFTNLDIYVGRAVGLSPEDRGFLEDRLQTLRTAYADVAFTLPPGVIHGDAHRKNIVRGSDGQSRLLDLDHVGVGAREWDLIVAAVYHRIGWYDADEYRRFAKAYGFDVMAWDGFPVLAGIRQLRMTAWLAARTGREPRLVPEVRNRIASLRNPSTASMWTPGT